MRKFWVVAFVFLILPPLAEARRAKHAPVRDDDRESEFALASAPKDNEICFSPDEPCAAKLIKFIQTAKTSIDIAIFEMTNRKIAEAIVEAAKTVKVRMVVNRKLVKDSGPAYEIIKAAGVPIRAGKQKGIMHNKFTIVDGKRMETGSFNYTYAAGNSNQENQFYIGQPAVVERYHERFEKMWREGKH